MKNNTDDKNGKEQLAEGLKARLKWYQEEATPEEMDVEEISGILALLEQLAPLEREELPDKEEAYRKFEEQYIEKEDKAERRKTAQRKMFWKSRMVRYAVTAAAMILLLFSVLNIGTYAAAKKGFFEFIRQEKDGKSFFVNGDAGNAEVEISGYGTTEYDSWEMLIGTIAEQIYVPTYISEDLRMESLTYLKGRYTENIKAVYQDKEKQRKLHVLVESYDDNYTWQKAIDSEATLLTKKALEEKDCFFYEYQEECYIYFFDGNKLYTIFGNLTIEELEKIVEGMELSP